MAFLKPQSPLTKGNDYFYPLTTADQVIMQGGYRLDQIVGKVEKSTITLYANGWSAEAPYSQSIVVEGLDDNLNMKMFPHFPEDFEGKQAMKEETAKISFASRNGSILTFECWDEVPTIDIPVDIEIDITYPGIPDIKINYSVAGGTEEPANPTENMIWVNTDQEITDYILSKYEPKNPIEGMIWIFIGNDSSVAFHSLIINEKKYDEIYPISTKQYVSGAWVDKTAKSWQNGEWVDWWNGELFDPDNEYEDITGGWIATAPIGLQAGYINQKEPTVVKDTEGVTLTVAGGQTSGMYQTKNKINLKNYKTLYCDGTLTSNTFSCLGIWSDFGDYKADNLVASCSDFDGVTSINISSLDQEYYIGFYLYGVAGHSVSMRRMWLE